MSRNLPGLPKRKNQKRKKNLATSETYFLWAIALTPLLPVVSLFLAYASRKSATDASGVKLASVALGMALVCFLLQSGLITWAAWTIFSAINQATSNPSISDLI